MGGCVKSEHYLRKSRHSQRKSRHWTCYILVGACCVLAMDLLRLTTKQVSFFARKNLLLLPVNGKEYF